jgi:hypothetical protein
MWHCIHCRSQSREMMHCSHYGNVDDGSTIGKKGRKCTIFNQMNLEACRP